MKCIISLIYGFSCLLALLFANSVDAKTQIINLIVANEQVNFTGKPAQAIAVNY